MEYEMMRTKEEILIELLKERHYTFSSAESCTGGMLMSTLVNVAGASAVINEGFITYANDAKRKYLFVKEETLANFGAVSEQTACEMAQGLVKQTQADVTAAITGIAGPDGGTVDKPVGTIYIACCIHEQTFVKRLNLQGDRLSIRTQTVSQTLNFLLDCIRDSEKNS
jgi:PncC family amidohydrolase